MGDEKDLKVDEQLNFFEEEPAGDPDAEPHDGELDSAPAPVDGEDGCGCEEQEEEQTAKGKGKGDNASKATKTTKAAATPAPAPKKATTGNTYTYPFGIRYAAELLWLTGFVDGVTYTTEEIVDLLVQNGYTEFRDMPPDFHLSEKKDEKGNVVSRTLVITIRGSQKGGGAHAR